MWFPSAAENHAVHGNNTGVSFPANVSEATAFEFSISGVRKGTPWRLRPSMLRFYAGEFDKARCPSGRFDGDESAPQNPRFKALRQAYLPLL